MSPTASPGAGNGPISVRMDERWHAAEEELRDTRNELHEAQLEIARHHRDFQWIRELLELAEGVNAPETRITVLKQIRNIVG